VVTGSQRGSHPGERVPTQANRYGQTARDHPASRTDPNDSERLTGIYGSDGCSAADGGQGSSADALADGYDWFSYLCFDRLGRLGL
jgi:hypothetical protein